MLRESFPPWEHVSSHWCTYISSSLLVGKWLLLSHYTDAETQPRDVKELVEGQVEGQVANRYQIWDVDPWDIYTAWSVNSYAVIPAWRKDSLTEPAGTGEGARKP